MPRTAKITTALLLGFVLVFSAVFCFSGRDGSSRVQTTDDAYVRVDATRVAPQIDGLVVSVPVEENSPVSRGDLLCVIDERGYALEVAAREAALAQAQAQLAALREQAARQEDVIAEAAAVVAADRATVELDRLEFTRYRNLASDGSGSRQNYQKATAAYRVAQAALDRDTARHSGEIRQLAVLKAQIGQAEAVCGAASAALDMARLDLSYCRVTAPVDGVVSQKAARVGGYFRKGEMLLAVVPLEAIYVDAYFRETQIAGIRPGQSVSIAVDAYPGRTFTGTVESLGPASNASFSQIAPHSTSSNFTKIVQRLPVRIAITDPDRGLLKVGMSVVPSVDTLN